MQSSKLPPVHAPLFVERARLEAQSQFASSKGLAAQSQLPSSKEAWREAPGWWRGPNANHPVGDRCRNRVHPSFCRSKVTAARSEKWPQFPWR